MRTLFVLVCLILSLYIAQNQGQNLPDWAFCAQSCECTNGCCSKQYSSDGMLKCTPGGTTNQCVGSAKPNLNDWQMCAISCQCIDGCCSKEFSNDGQLKCTPGGTKSKCVTTNGTNPTPPPNGKYKNWAGSNLYYAAGLSTSQQQYLFQGLKSAGVKVLRVWLDGQSSGSTKGTPITAYPSLEPSQIGHYDDTVLKLYDAFMINAKNYGIKLLISMHSFNSLQANDVYGKAHGVQGFYENSETISQFDARLKHVLNHVHSTLNKPWKQLKEYIFAFEAQNEAMIGLGSGYIAAHQNWQCDRAKTIKDELGQNSGILVTTGGESWLDESMQPNWFNCASLDVLAIHGYGTGDFNTGKIESYVNKAVSSGKKLLFQEWGACYYNTENNNCPKGGVLPAETRNNNIKNWANSIAAAGVPWMYWQIIPNNDPHYDYDFEIGIGEASWGTFEQVAVNAQSYTTPFDYTPYLL